MYKEILRREPQHNGLRCLIWKCVFALVCESVGDRQPPLALMFCESLSCYKAENTQKTNSELLTMFGNIRVSIQFSQSRSGS